MSDIEPSVVFRTGPITERDYDEAIEYLQEAKRLGITGCPCGDSGHSAESCHHNPLLQARRGAAKDHEFRCFHCGQVFSEETAREHFGNDENGQAKCESEVKATLALFAQRVAGHMFVDCRDPFHDGRVMCACNAVLKDDYRTSNPSGQQAWQEHILSLPDHSALAAHDAALTEKIRLAQWAVGNAQDRAARMGDRYDEATEKIAKLEADNAGLREALDWALGIVQVSIAGARLECSRCRQAKQCLYPSRAAGFRRAAFCGSSPEQTKMARLKASLGECRKMWERLGNSRKYSEIGSGG